MVLRFATNHCLTLKKKEKKIYKENPYFNKQQELMFALFTIFNLTESVYNRIDCIIIAV